MGFKIEKTEEMDWGSQVFTLYLTQELSPAQREAIEQIIYAWYTVGAYGGFGGLLHYRSDVGFNEEDGQHLVEWYVDMGSAATTAYQPLLQCLDTYCTSQKIEIKKLLLGARIIE